VIDMATIKIARERGDAQVRKRAENAMRVAATRLI